MRVTRGSYAAMAIARYTSDLAAARLIELTLDKKWQLTRLGEAMLAPRGYWLH